MSEYRDALGTAQERVARLEALAKERGLPHRSNRGRNIAIGAVVVSAACAGIYVSLHAWREASVPTEEVEVSRVAPPPPAVPMPERDLEWYEPADSWNPMAGPQEASFQGKHLIIGLLWHRGERTNGLYLGAFDYDTLEKRWVAGPFESDWTGEEDERFHVAVSDSSAIVTDSAGLIRVFSIETGLLVGKRTMPRGTLGLCRTVRGPAKWMVGFGAHNEANTAHALFPWELDNIKPYYFDPQLLSLTRAPNSPPEGTWCGSGEYCDPSRKDRCRDEAGRWRIGSRFVKIEQSDRIPTITGWTMDTKGIPVQRWVHPITTDGDLGTSTIGDQYFFHGYQVNGQQAILGLDLDTGNAHGILGVPKSPGAQLRLLKWISPDRLFALYDDEMLVFKANGERVGKVSATP